MFASCQKIYNGKMAFEKNLYSSSLPNCLQWWQLLILTVQNVLRTVLSELLQIVVGSIKSGVVSAKTLMSG